MTAIIITLLAILLIICFVYTLYLKYKKTYTRERFAFFGVTILASAILNLGLQISSSLSINSAILQTSNFFFKTTFEPVESNWKDYTIAIIGVLIIWSTVMYMFTNWNGLKSEKQFQDEKYSKESGLITEAYIQLRDFISKNKKIVLHEDKDLHSPESIFVRIEDDKIPWYIDVFELLTFSDKQYKIDPVKDYYSNEKCFICKYGINDIAILCSIDYPNEITIRNFIVFVEKQKLDNPTLIIALKQQPANNNPLIRNEKKIMIKTEEEMLNALIDFAPYIDYVNSVFEKNDISEVSNLKLKDIYVPLKATCNSENLIENCENYIYEWLNSNEDKKHIAVLGEYGCGKSVLSLKITQTLLKNYDKFGRIPLLIELRGKSPRNLNVQELLSLWGTNFRIDSSALMKLHKAGRLLIIFEGFDEMDMVGDSEQRLNHFQRLWEFSIPKSKIIITGRPNFFLDDKDLKTSLGIDRPYHDSYYCEALHLEKFDVPQIKSALRNIDPKTSHQILEVIQNSNNSNFKDLVSRPSILYLVSILWKENFFNEISEKISSAFVISEFIKYSYSRQSSKRADFPLTEREREYFMIGVSVGMSKLTGYSNQIKKSDLEMTCIPLYEEFPSNMQPNENAIQSNKKHLKVRMKDNVNAIETIMTDIRSCGILVKDITRVDYFKFAHKSFLEYQLSLFYVESLLQDKGVYNEMVNAIKKALQISHKDSVQSKETIQFASEILISKLQLSQHESKITVCKKLFEVLHPSNFLCKKPKLAAWLDMYFNTSLGIILPSFIVLLVTLFNNSSIGNLVIVTVCLLSSSIVMWKRFYSFKNHASIWLESCNQLNITEEEIYQVVPKKYIKYITSDDGKITLIKAVEIMIERTIFNQR